MKSCQLITMSEPDIEMSFFSLTITAQHVGLLLRGRHRARVAARRAVHVPGRTHPLDLVCGGQKDAFVTLANVGSTLPLESCEEMTPARSG